MLICHVPNFNSIKVRLKRDGSFSFTAPTLFQFHKGTIKTTYALTRDTALLDFNSIKVRLKLG